MTYCNTAEFLIDPDPISGASDEQGKTQEDAREIKIHGERFRGAAIPQLRRIGDKHGIIVNANDMLLLSMTFFNTGEEIEKAVSVILRETGRRRPDWNAHAK